MITPKYAPELSVIFTDPPQHYGLLYTDLHTH